MGYAHSARARNRLDGGVALETTNAAAGAAFFHCVPSSTFRIGDKPTKAMKMQELSGRAPAD
jgi:hypothetical protein